MKKCFVLNFFKFFFHSKWATKKMLFFFYFFHSFTRGKKKYSPEFWKYEYYTRKEIKMSITKTCCIITKSNANFVTLTLFFSYTHEKKWLLENFFSLLSFMHEKKFSWNKKCFTWINYSFIYLFKEKVFLLKSFWDIYFLISKIENIFLWYLHLVLQKSSCQIFFFTLFLTFFLLTFFHRWKFRKNYLGFSPV